MKSLPFILAFSFALVSCREENKGSRSIVGGSWGSVCVPIAGSMPSTRIQYVFQDDHRVFRHQQFYLDAACGELAGEISHEGDFYLEVRNETSVFNIDMFFTGVTASAQTVAGAKHWNTIKLCGYEDWNVVPTKVVTANPTDGCLSFAVQRIEYRDVVEVVADEQLTFGQTLGHLVPRPDTVKVSDPLETFRFISH